jgi:DNA-binding transcriptional regulator GbsR (MarR family)
MVRTTHTRAASEEDRISRFIESMGLLTEAEGFPRIAGRLFGLLLLTPGDLSLDEIADRLGVSKASVSNDARRLQQMGFVERRGRPGDRRDYYAIAPNAFACSLEMRLERMHKFHKLLETAHELSDDEEVRARLHQLETAYELTVRTLREVLSRAGEAESEAPPRG